MKKINGFLSWFSDSAAVVHRCLSITLGCLLIIACLLVKFAVYLAGVSIICIYVYSEVLGGNLNDFDNPLALAALAAITVLFFALDLAFAIEI